MLAASFRILSNTTGLELTPSVGNAGDDRTATGARAGVQAAATSTTGSRSTSSRGSCRSKRHGRRDDVHAADRRAAAAPRQDDRERQGARRDARRLRRVAFNQCRHVFKFLYGRDENQCEAKVFDACVDALATRRPSRPPSPRSRRTRRSANEEATVNRKPSSLPWLDRPRSRRAAAIDPATAQPARRAHSAGRQRPTRATERRRPRALAVHRQARRAARTPSSTARSSRQRAPNENVGVNRARFKPFAVMAGEYQRVLGVVLRRASRARRHRSTSPAARWYAEAQLLGRLAQRDLRRSRSRVASPTRRRRRIRGGADRRDRAHGVRSAHAQGVEPRRLRPKRSRRCADLATKKLAAEPDARRRWAYACASVLSSSQFLTF